MNAHQDLFDHFREKDKYPSELENRAAQKASVPLRRNWWAEQLEQTRDMPALRDQQRDTQNWGMGS